jgi:alpha-L-fucosidase 2
LRLTGLIVGGVAVAVALVAILHFILPGSAAPTPASATSASRPRATEIPLARYFDNVAVTSNSDPTIGNLDGSGSAFSLQALAAAGVRPGGVITYQGVPFTWPDVVAGKPDNVTASGQTLTVRGAGTSLAFLLNAGWGPARGAATVVYANGSRQMFRIAAPDWYTSCHSAGGPDVAVFTPYRNQGNGAASFTTCLYYASVRLRSAQPVQAIVLPDISPPLPRSGKPSLHIFAITIR